MDTYGYNILEDESMLNFVVGIQEEACKLSPSETDADLETISEMLAAEGAAESSVPKDLEQFFAEKQEWMREFLSSVCDQNLDSPVFRLPSSDSSVSEPMVLLPSSPVSKIPTYVRKACDREPPLSVKAMLRLPPPVQLQHFLGLSQVALYPSMLFTGERAVWPAKRFLKDDIVFKVELPWQNFKDQCQIVICYEKL